MFPLSLFSPTFLQYSACKTGARKYYLMDNYESCNFIGIFLFVINSHLTQFTVRRNSRRFFGWSYYSVLYMYLHRLPHLTKFVFDIILLVCIYIWNISIRIRSQSKSVTRTHTSTLQWDCLSGLILLLSHSPCGFIPTDNLN